MNEFFDSFATKIDIYIVGLVLLSGFFQNKYFKGFKINKKDESYDSALKTLLLSAVVSVVYIYLLKDPEKADNWSKYFISYFMATSIYELIVSKFVDWIKLKTGK
jgi:putative effector of murein hydrolase LrgA (UPF0299 family)